jgi:ubiquinol-cytochrome c reductase cytochrome b subunit
LGGAGLFVIYPFVDRELTRRGWPMDAINAAVGTVVVVAVALLMYLDTQM